jgi:hypothetical protein
MPKRPPEHPWLVFLKFIVIVICLGCLLGWIGAIDLSDKLRIPFIAAFVMIVAATTIGFFALVFGIAFTKLYWRKRRWRSEKYIFSLARKSAGVEGATARFGPISAWMSDPGCHLPALKEQLAIACDRFEQALGDRPAAAKPLRVVCFGLNDEFARYFQKLGLRFGNLDSVYLQVKPPQLIACLDQESERPLLLERSVRASFCFYLIDEYKGFMPAGWLNSSLGHLLASYGESDVLARINRKMLAALERGSVLGVQQLFHITPRRMLSLMSQWRDFTHYAELAQFAYQGHSVLHYLCGHTAPEERRARFRAFFKELGKKDRYEEVFARHLGFGFDQLLRQWQDWVRSLGHGKHEPPPPRIRKALLRRVIPFLRDPNVSVDEATLAVRDMGASGYTLGADTLIEMLEMEESKELCHEVVWALESIAGYAHGNDVSAWKAWWESLPTEVEPVDVHPA